MRYLMPLLTAAASVLITSPAYADLGDQLFKLLPDDGGQGDSFGVSVAISGATAIVGAQSHFNNNDCWCGAAYLFDTTTGQQLFELQPDDGATGSFGARVAISGTTAIVGDPFHENKGIQTGAAYLFDTTTGRQIAKLLADDGTFLDHFGYAVAISGTTAIVGAKRHNDNGILSGAAYLFDTATGQQLFKILPTDGAASDYFGSSVAISGPPGKEIAIVGAHLDDDTCGGNPGCNSGSAYLFDISDPANPTQLAKLLADDGAAGDYFGRSVAISGATAMVGARRDDDNGDNSGSAYLFDISDPANPTQIAKLLPDDGAAGDAFGYSVAISGATAIVGAAGDDDNGDGSGSAYLFGISDPANPTQIAKLLPDDGAQIDFFGDAVAISGTPGKETAIVGAWADDDNGTDSGSAYLFDAAAPGTCPWDLDGTGSVGASDLLALLATWGPCKGCPADFDNNGTVGASDLLALLVNWGPCP